MPGIDNWDIAEHRVEKMYQLVRLQNAKAFPIKLRGIVSRLSSAGPVKSGRGIRWIPLGKIAC